MKRNYILLLNITLILNFNNLFAQEKANQIKNLTIEFDISINISDNIEFEKVYKSIKKVKSKELNDKKIRDIIINNGDKYINRIIYFNGVQFPDLIKFSSNKINIISAVDTTKHFKNYINNISSVLRIVKENEKMFLIQHLILKTDNEVKADINKLKELNLGIQLSYVWFIPKKILPTLYSDIKLYSNNENIKTYLKKDFIQLENYSKHSDFKVEDDQYVDIDFINNNIYKAK